MNEREIKIMRKAAEICAEDGDYVLEDNGRVIMFGLTKERAEEFARYYKNPTISKRTCLWGR